MKLLVEIGVEELPAIPFLKELSNIKPKWNAILNEYGLNGNFEIDFTPRRLVISGDIAEYAKDLQQENIGAPKQIALVEGKWSNAALGFAKKYSIKEEELEFKNINGKEVLYYQSIIKGKKTSILLPKIIDEFIKSLNFGKSMRWGENNFEFIRPIRSIIAMLENENINIEIYGVKSKKGFYPHRNFGYQMVEFNTTEEYFALLKKNGVILKSDDRKKKILIEFEKIQKSSGLQIELDLELLNEVVTITEYPTALLGSFADEFLEIPKEVIITSMKENQRYFPLCKDGNLKNFFVIVSNAICDDYSVIIKGNEKVLRARLSDAKFFWHSDLANEFSSDKLKNITYLNELGSIYDKEIREREISRILAKIYDQELKTEFHGDYGYELDRAVMLSKADLATNMVYEFTNLQGIMGSYYAENRKENQFLVSALKEQYLPNSEKNEYPTSLFSSIVSLSNKLDTLMGLFSIRRIPSGNKDPYALRRAASGIIKTVLNLDLNFDIKNVLESIQHNYKPFELNELIEFIFDRLYTIYKANPSVIKACLKSSTSDIKKLNSAILALEEICKDKSFKEKFSTFKRLANIIRDHYLININEDLFEHESEKILNEKFHLILLRNDDIKGYLSELFELKPYIDNFFDSVMINHEDEKIRMNRLSLIGQIYKAFLKVADIKEISA